MRRLVLSILASFVLVTSASATPLTPEVLQDSGTFVGSWTGNDCSGVFGRGFGNCYTPSGSPIIGKWDTDTGKWEFNDLFPTLTGVEWSIANGVWTYTPGPGDPIITHWVQKLGNGFELYRLDDVAPVNVKFTTERLSHLSFYDGGSVPEPTTILLLGCGFVALLLRKQ